MSAPVPEASSSSSSTQLAASCISGCIGLHLAAAALALGTEGCLAVLHALVGPEMIAARGGLLGIC